MNLTNHKFIVFGEEHYNPLGIVRSLGEEGIRPVVIVIKGAPTLLSKSKYISKLFCVENREDGFKLLLQKYGNNNEKPFLYSSDDATEALFDANYEMLKDKFYFFNAGNKNQVLKYMNKRTIGELALKHGLRFLEYSVVTRGVIPEDLEYPVITKAIDSTVGGWKKDMFICYNEQELKSAYDKISSPVVMVQKYIAKKNEYCLEGFSVAKGRDIFISIASTYKYRLPLSYSPYMMVNNFDRMSLQKKLSEMMSEIGYEGIFEIEFLVSDTNELYFGEINFRNSTWSYASTCAGMNLPVLWAKSMLMGKRVEGCYVNIPKPGFTAMVELTDFKERVLKKKISVYKWIKQLMACQCKYYIGNKDLRPVIAMIISRIRHNY